MNLEEAYEWRRREMISLQHQVDKYKEKLDLVDQELYTPAEKAANYNKINHLSHDLIDANKECDRYHRQWEREFNRHTFLELENTSLLKENELLKKENDSLKQRIASLEEAGVEEAAAKIKALTDEVCRLTAIINNDGTNSGTPTSKTPLNKKKVIPNLREKTGRKKGGQPGHKQHTLPAISDGEETAVEEHLSAECPYCHSISEDIGYDEKDELDYEVRIIKRRHRFHKYLCPVCGREHRAYVPVNLKEKCQYGSSIKATALALLDLGFVSVNRAKKLLHGIFNGQLSPCESYIIGMQKKAAKKLTDFTSDVKRRLAGGNLLYWDDTVIFINTKRSCMRFYGTENLALFTAHETKGREGIDEDGLLALMSAESYVMHDHVTMNYNPDFCFINLECNQHLQRDLKKLSDISGHEWALQLRDLISATIHDRKEKQKSGETAFDPEYIQAFNARIDELLNKGDAEQAKDPSRYYAKDELNLLARIRKYRDNYFMWVTDFKLPTTNNLSERSLRFTKIHEKVSGQFESLEYAKYFASIRTYLETCARNGINEYTALLRLTQDNPFSLSEVLSYSGSV
jgi:transposase